MNPFPFLCAHCFTAEQICVKKFAAMGIDMSLTFMWRTWRSCKRSHTYSSYPGKETVTGQPLISRDFHFRVPNSGSRPFWGLPLRVSVIAFLERVTERKTQLNSTRTSVDCFAWTTPAVTWEEGEKRKMALNRFRSAVPLKSAVHRCPDVWTVLQPNWFVGGRTAGFRLLNEKMLSPPVSVQTKPPR